MGFYILLVGAPAKRCVTKGKKCALLTETGAIRIATALSLGSHVTRWRAACPTTDSRLSFRGQTNCESRRTFDANVLARPNRRVT